MSNQAQLKAVAEAIVEDRGWVVDRDTRKGHDDVEATFYWYAEEAVSYGDILAHEADKVAKMCVKIYDAHPRKGQFSSSYYNR